MHRGDPFVVALIGAHVSIAGGLFRALERGEALGCEAIQIFTKNQLQWKASPLSFQECERFFSAWRKSSIKEVVAHASYLINLAAEGSVHRDSVDALLLEMERCDHLGIGKLVLHPGSSKTRSKEDGLVSVADGLKSVLEKSVRCNVQILLETMSGQGNTLGGRLEDFRVLLEELDWDARIGLCLDTCHILSAGYELRSLEAYKRYLDAVEKLVGAGRVACWHFNDSKNDKGERKDRHEHLGDGALGLTPFSFIVNDERWQNTPCLLETPKSGRGDAGNLQLLRKLRGE
jgi:deoxyribonuclease-4